MNHRRPVHPCATFYDRASGWDIFKVEGYFTETDVSFFGVHRDTGAERHADISGRASRLIDARTLRTSLRKLAAMGFPPRVGDWPLTIAEIDALQQRSAE